MKTIEEFASLVQADQEKGYIARGFTKDVHKHNWTTHIRPGKKYTKVDVGNSGKFMVDQEGNIFGIKGYGTIHRGHQYGTLQTTAEWFWGNYTPIKRAAA
jgi:hypothetical protein